MSKKNAVTPDFSKLSELVKDYTKNISDIDVELKNIDAKYEKLKAEESAALLATKTCYETAISGLQSILGGITKTETPVKEKTKQKAEEEEVVVDTLYPENNDNTVEETTAVLVEEIAEEVSDDNTASSEDIWNEEELSSDTENVEENSETSDEAEENDSEEEWPDIPEEW